ncbi:MAG TPA: hypothetical protein VGG29_20335 [Caulobacteraceae bacterium]|jgi:hypothetical protein
MGRNVVIGLAAVVALLVIAVIGVAGRDWIGGMIGGGHETPSVMIVSSDLLGSSIASQARAKLDEAAAKLGADVAKKATDAKTAASPAAEPRTPAQMQADDLGLVVEAMKDSLGGRVSQALQESGRFQLIASSKVVDAMDVYAKQNNTTRNDLLTRFGGMVVGARTTPKGGTTTAATESQSSVLTHGLPEIGQHVGADYVLVVTLGEPHVGAEYAASGGGMPDRFTIIGQPIVNCEIFQTNGKLAYRFSQQLARPVTETLINAGGHPAELNAKVDRFYDRLNAAVSQQVLAWALDKIAPARIVQGGSTLIINRGTNDGVADGAVYQVEREVGDAVRDGPDGANLGRLRVPEGSIVIQRAQERISTATVASGGPFLKDDVVDVMLPAKPNGAPGAQVAGQHGPLNVAVDHVRLGGVESAPLAQAVSDALAADGRIAVLPRAELGNLSSERRFNAAAGDDYGETLAQGMRQSDYLVDGDCTTSSQRHASYISVDGVRQETSSHVTSSASCTLRATAVDGRLIGTASQDGGSVTDAAQQTARALLATIVQSAGSAAAPAPQPAVPPPAAPPPSNAVAAAPPPAPRPKVAAERRRAGPPAKARDEASGIHF